MSILSALETSFTSLQVTAKATHGMESGGSETILIIIAVILVIILAIFFLTWLLGDDE